LRTSKKLSKTQYTIQKDVHYEYSVDLGSGTGSQCGYDRWYKWCI